MQRKKTPIAKVYNPLPKKIAEDSEKSLAKKTAFYETMRTKSLRKNKRRAFAKKEMQNKTRPFAKKTKKLKKKKKLKQNFLKKIKTTCKKKHKTNTFCEKQQNKTEQNKTTPLAKQSKSLTKKTNPVANNKTLQNLKKLQLFLQEKTKNKTKNKTTPLL